MSNSGGQKYLDPKTIQRIKRLDVRARLVVEGFITGQHQSPYHGFAIEFAGHREYAPGDDIRHIDWKVWSKTDRLYIKQYEEETNLACTVLLDASKSMRYGEAKPQHWSKFDYGATLAASLLYLLHQQQDAVGLVTFNTAVDRNLAPKTHPSHLKRIFAELEDVTPDKKTDVGEVFLRLAGQIRRRGMVALVSDLLVDPHTFAQALDQLRLRRHEVIVFHVLDEDELNFPFQDNTLFRGLEVDAQLHAEPRALRRSYLQVLQSYLDTIRRLCAAANVDYLLVNTSEPLDAALARYLAFRKTTRRNIARH